MNGEHWTTDRMAGKCASCEQPYDGAHFVDGHAKQMCKACCIHCNAKPTEPMEPIGKTIAGEQEKLL